MPACHDATATRPAVTTAAVTTCTQSIRLTSDRSPNPFATPAACLHARTAATEQQQRLDSV